MKFVIFSFLNKWHIFGVRKLQWVRIYSIYIKNIFFKFHSLNYFFNPSVLFQGMKIICYIFQQVACFWTQKGSRIRKIWFLQQTNFSKFHSFDYFFFPWVNMYLTQGMKLVFFSFFNKWHIFGSQGGLGTQNFNKWHIWRDRNV